MADLNQEQLAIDAIKMFLNITNNIDLDVEEITPATRSAIGEMRCTGRELLEYYSILTPNQP